MRRGETIEFVVEQLQKKFEHLVAAVYEVQTPEKFRDNFVCELLIVIKQEKYSLVSTILMLADSIFGPAFLRTGFLFALHIKSRDEFKTSAYPVTLPAEPLWLNRG